MPDLELERADLARAEIDIVDGERRITVQRILVARLCQDGHDVTQAERLLADLEQTLETWQAHWALILAAIARPQDAPNPYDWDDLP